MPLTGWSGPVRAGRVARGAVPASPSRARQCLARHSLALARPDQAALPCRAERAECSLRPRPKSTQSLRPLGPRHRPSPFTGSLGAGAAVQSGPVRAYRLDIPADCQHAAACPCCGPAPRRLPSRPLPISSRAGSAGSAGQPKQTWPILFCMGCAGCVTVRVCRSGWDPPSPYWDSLNAHFTCVRHASSTLRVRTLARKGGISATRAVAADDALQQSWRVEGRGGAELREGPYCPVSATRADLLLV